MAEYEVVYIRDNSTMLPGGHYRDYVRAEIMVGKFGPFMFEVDKKPGWEQELRAKFQEQVTNVRILQA